jgi:hypothetical protein
LRERVLDDRERLLGECVGIEIDELEDVIMHNALQHLLVLPNTNWSDRELAAYHAKQFIFHLSERRARANLGNVRGVMTARMQRFGV